MRRTIGSTLAFGWLALMGCDGGGPEHVAPSVRSPSFSPTTGTTADGAPAAELWWRHRLHRGMAWPIDVNGTPGTMKLGDRLTRVIDGGTRRISTLEGDLTSGTGADRLTLHTTQRFDEILMRGPPAAVVSTMLDQEQNSTPAGIPPLNLVLTSMSMPAMPLVDFGDRADLDQVPVGPLGEATVMTATSIAVTTTSGGTPNTIAMTLRSSDHTRWTILEQLPSLTVLGETYARVVKVQVDVESTDLDTSEVSSAANTFWLAAGIGIVRAEQVASPVVDPIPVDLADTNLGL
jgi:hypothetical protein